MDQLTVAGSSVRNRWRDRCGGEEICRFLPSWRFGGLVDIPQCSDDRFDLLLTKLEGILVSDDSIMDSAARPCSQNTLFSTRVLNPALTPWEQIRTGLTANGRGRHTWQISYPTMKINCDITRHIAA